MKLINYEGRKIGLLTVLRLTDKIKHSRSKVYTCECECGQLCEVSTAEFSSRKSCGCLRKKCKENFAANSRKQKPPNMLKPGESAYRALFSSYKVRAKKRSIIFELTDHQFKNLVTQNCSYCGKEPMQVAKTQRNNGKFLYNGIDRINNTLGYTLENSNPCCKICNRAKDVMSFDDFTKWIVQVHSTLKL